MKIYINNINGRDYLYAYDTIFLAKGKNIRKNKSLGRVDSLSDISSKKHAFSLYLLKEEKKLRAAYWKRNISHKDFVKYVSVDKIESVRTELYRAKEEMGSIGNIAMETAFLVDFIYNSNKIEGSKIPRENVEKQVREGGRPKNDEIGNTMKAVYYVDNKFKFNLSQIDKLHSILLAHEPSKLGYREEKVVVGDEEVAEWRDVKPRLKELIEWYDRSRKTWYPPELAFTFYYRFERIHPFVDGNGRMGRLIMNKILKDHRYHPMIVWNRRREAHMSVFKSFSQGKREKYFKFMAEQFIKTHEIYLAKIQKAFDLQEKMNFFLEPSEYNLG
jgi:Fic family protein